MVTKVEANNWGKEKKDYIKEALENTGKELSQLQRASFIEKVSNNKWNYRLDTAKAYLEGIRNDYSYLNLSKNRTTTVMATQIALFKAWFMWVGHIDAKWWPYTMSCIKKFQRKYDLPVSWYLTKRTVDKLLAVAAEKQWLAPETKKQKEQETKKQSKKPAAPTPSTRRTQTPETKKQNPDNKPANNNIPELEIISKTDTLKIRNAIKQIWEFDAYQNFIIKNGKEISRGNKKYLQILGTEYEEYPSWWLEEPENKTSKNWYHNGWDFFIFWKFIDNRCYDWIKVSRWWDVIEKWSFDIKCELDENKPSSKREFLNPRVKNDYENPDATPNQYKYNTLDNQPG